MKSISQMNDFERLEMLKKANEQGLTPQEYLASQVEAPSSYDMDVTSIPIKNEEPNWNMMSEVQPVPQAPKKRDLASSTIEPLQLEEPKKAVQEYLMNKFQSQGPSELELAEKSYKEKSSDLAIPMFLSGLGGALSGRGFEPTQQAFSQIQKNLYDTEVGALDRKQKREKDNHAFTKEKDKSDPNSAQSQNFRKIIEANFPNIAKAYGEQWSQVTAADKNAIFKPLQLKEQIEGRKEQARILSSQREEAQREKTESKKAAAQQKIDESQYRYNILNTNLNKLQKLVEENGTNSLVGAEGDEMDSLVYQAAVDYAKLVDPESVAREGEVAAAQKYMIPFRNNYGLTTRASTALEQIKNYKASLDERLKARNDSKGLSLRSKTEAPPQKFPIQVKKDGQVATVTNEEELREAQEEGWK
jgi:hypothetical protein